MNEIRTPNKSLPVAILKAGLLAGFLDIVGAFVYHLISGKKNPSGILKYIASGIFGNDAFTEGKIMIAWGFLFHFIIAIIITAIYFLIYPKVKFLSRNIVASGLFFGLCIWLVMNLLIVPVSNAPLGTLRIIGSIVGIVIIMFAVGLPVAVLAYRYYKK